METGRLATFADGVFAITATWLILNVDTYVRSCAAEDADIANTWCADGPSCAAYAVSFLSIGIC